MHLAIVHLGYMTHAVGVILKEVNYSETYLSVYFRPSLTILV